LSPTLLNPKLLDQFRDARQKMARTYVYEGATDFNTGMVDVSKLARITAKDNALTGDIASLGKIAGNFPDVFTTTAASKFYDLPRLTPIWIRRRRTGALIWFTFWFDRVNHWFGSRHCFRRIWRRRWLPSAWRRLSIKPV
jgi:hypothetical protein